jgi:hypothetical protein
MEMVTPWVTEQESNLLSSIDFEGDIRQEILKWLPFDKSDQDLAADIAAMPTTDLLIRFYNWLGRLIHPHPREVFLSTDCRHRQLPAREQALLEKLRDKIELGGDLSAHLSKRVVHGLAKSDPKTAGRNLHRRQDLDLLVNDWGIHHLHLSDVLKQDGFVERDDLLLFAIFRSGQAFLLDVLSHGAWTNDSLVAAAVRNWPVERLFVPLSGALGLSQTILADDRKHLRGAGVSTFIKIDGIVYAPKDGGLSTAGTPTGAAMKAFQVIPAKLGARRCSIGRCETKVTEINHFFWTLSAERCVSVSYLPPVLPVLHSNSKSI